MMKYDGHKNILYSDWSNTSQCKVSALTGNNNDYSENGLCTKLYNQLEISAYFHKYCSLFQLFVFE
jgi:hypothetical protein